MRSLTLALVLSIFIALAGNIGAVIINIPGDYSAIQAGIDASSDGDTVLVQHGTYQENINFNGHNIIVASRYLLDSSYYHIRDTEIGGENSAPIIAFENGEDSTAILIGFTLIGGSLDDGGGVHCSSSSPKICYNIIDDHYAFFDFSGAINCVNSSPVIEGNWITNNYGGGIHCESDCQPVILNNYIADNTNGGGIWSEHGRISGNVITHNVCGYDGAGGISAGDALVMNNTITNNVGFYGGGIYSMVGRPTLVNNIVWNNASTYGGEIYGGFQSVRYNNIKSGWPGEGNIDCEPVFCNLSDGDFHLALNSCCVGAGENGVDIGAFGVGCDSQIPELINVPADYLSIQSAIYAASDGDTILVQPDIYRENITFAGKKIVLASLFLTTGDTSYITSTVIMGYTDSSVVTFDHLENENAVITGFTIENGTSYDYAGGIHCSSSSPTITHNIITDDTTLNWETAGGISCHNGASPTIKYNTIRRCYGYDGGAIACFNNSNAIIENNLIVNNRSFTSGAGVNCVSSNATIRYNIFYDDTCSRRGGAIGCNANSNCEISYNTMTNNVSGRWGGAIYISGSNPLISFNVVKSNLAYQDGGAISCLDSSIPLIMNNTIIGNVAQDQGGGFYSESSNATVKDNILWANSADIESNEIHLASGSAQISYCDIQDTIWPGDGNISCEPAFCDIEAENYRLDLTSCCIHAGENGLNIGAMGIGCQGENNYIPGDINMAIGNWPPAVIGSDVTYLVNFFRSNPANPSCLINNLFCSADVNGDCHVIGGDVTKLVSYFRGLTTLGYCPDYPPAWLTPADLPSEAPVGWPGCE